MLDAFEKAIRRFNGEYVLCKEKRRNIPLKEAITLVIQPRGESCRVQDETKTLLENLGWTKK